MEQVKVQTIAEIVKKCEGLRPKEALSLLNGELEAKCTSGVVSRIINDAGQEVELHLVNGKYVAIYVRVSKDAQRSKKQQKSDSKKHEDDGYSERDQLESTIRWCINKGLAYRVFSDAGMSGGLPPLDPVILKELYEDKADRFSDVFKSIWINDAMSKYKSEEERDALTAYCEERVASILKGADGIEDLEASTPDRPRKNTDFMHRRKTVMYRPALTVLIAAMPRVHTIIVTDQSRFSRSLALLLWLAKKLTAHKIDFIGVLEPVVDHRTAQGQLISMIVGWIADARLREVCSNALRGQMRMLESGRCAARDVFWLERDEDGYARIKLDKDGRAVGVETLKRMVELYLADEERGMKVVCGTLNDEKRPAPRGGTVWKWATVRNVLRNRALIGEQEMFGLRWPIMPPVIDEVTFARIQAKQTKRANTHNFRKVVERDCYLMMSLLRCPCGKMMGHVKKSEKTPAQYACHDYGDRRAADAKKKHTVLNAADVDRFVNDLMRSHPIPLIEAAMGRNESGALNDAMQATQTQSEAREQDLRAAEQAAQQEASALFAALRHNESYDALLLQYVETKTEAARERLQTMRDTLADQKRKRDEYTPPVGYVDLETQVREWNSLTNEAKNKILRFIFSEWRIEGEAPNEKIIPARRTATNRDLLPIPLITGVGIRKKGARVGEPVYKRRLPDAAEWYADVKRYLTAPLTHVRNSTTGQMTPYRDDVLNFTLDTTTPPETNIDRSANEPITDMSSTVVPWLEDEE